VNRSSQAAGPATAPADAPQPDRTARIDKPRSKPSTGKPTASPSRVAAAA